MRKLQLLFLLGSLIFATGCPKYRPSVDFKNVDTFRGRLNEHLKNEQIKYYCYRDGKDYDDSTKPPHCTGASGSLADGPARAKQVRNELLDDALSYIDDAYGDFKADLAAGRDRANFLADVVDLGTSAAVGITNGERPLQILGVALTAFRGGRRSADLNFYKDQSTPILISKMNGNRALVRASILESEKKDIEAYRMGTAISDIVDYYNAGSLVEAFIQLAADTAVQTKEAEKELREMKKRAGIVGAATLDQIDAASANTQKLEGLAEKYEKATKDIADADADIANPAIADKTAANAKKAAAVPLQKEALDTMKKVYQLIEADPILRPLLDKIEAKYGKDSPALKTRIQQSLARLKDKSAANPATGQDYELILQLFGGIVVDNIPQDPTLKDRWKVLLATIQ